MKCKKIIMLMMMPLLLLMGIILSSCCSPTIFTVNVTHIGASDGLEYEDYSYEVNFNDNTKISITIPAGYDHSKVKAYVDDKEQTPEVVFEKEIADELKYSISKTLTYNFKFIKKSFDFKFDLSEVKKLKFDITLNGDLGDFKVLTFSDSYLNKLIMLNNEMVDDTIEFVDNVASVPYDSNVVLLYRNTRSYFREALYSRITNFTADRFKSSIGELNFAQYDLAKKANSRYFYNNDGYTGLYYVGKIKENISLFGSIPGYVADKRLQFDKNPNTFYLFTPLSDYDSDLFSLEYFTTTDKPYSEVDATLDRIDGNTVIKTKHSSVYRDRYDVHKIYLGDNLASDTLLNSDQKLNTNKDLYIRINTTLGLNYLRFRLLAYERQQQKHSDKYYINSSIVSSKGYTYVKLSKEDMDKFTDELTSTGGQKYSAGYAILYPELRDEFMYDDRGSGAYKYTRVWLKKEILSILSTDTPDDFYFNVYYKDDQGNRHYGFIDYHYEGYAGEPRDAVYFETDDLFDGEDYKHNLYCEVRGEKYKDHTSVSMESVSFYLGLFERAVLKDQYGESVLKITDPIENNSYEDFYVKIRTKEHSCEYTIIAEISPRGPFNTACVMDFSHMNFGTSILYITDQIGFSQITDFNMVREANKATFDNLDIGAHDDIYYFTRTINGSDMDIAICLDPEDPSTIISTSKVLRDILGNPLTIKISGLPYEVRTIKLDDFYSFLGTGELKLYVIEKES